MSHEQWFPLKGSKYGDGFFLEEYNEVYSLVSGKDTQNGKFKKWCRPQVGKDKFADKSIPIKVVLGNRDDAIGALKQLLSCFNVAEVLEPEEDAPF